MSSLTVTQAREHILDAVSPLPGSESVPLREALGRVLAEPLRAEINVPPHANSAMDGYAACSADLEGHSEVILKPTGTSRAGAPFEGSVGKGECVRIMTGAVLPRGADCVVMQEHVTLREDGILMQGGQAAGQNIRRPGEDIAKGRIALNAGKRLGAADIGLAASLGIAECPVKPRIKVAFCPTGDELRAPGEELQAGQIYDSNRYTLYSMLKKFGADIVELDTVADTPEAVRAMFDEASARADVLITAGGVSVGDTDYVKQILEERGQVNFWRVLMKPGHPLAFGMVDNTRFFGLPGNPVSVMVTFTQFVLPALQVMQGEKYTPPLRIRLRCISDLHKKPGRMDFQRGIIENAGMNELQVRSSGSQGSGVLSSMSQANCFIVLPAESSGTYAGDIVDVEPFAGFLTC